MRVSALDLARRDLTITSLEDGFEQMPAKVEALLEAANTLVTERPGDIYLLEVAGACQRTAAVQMRLRGDWERAAGLEARAALLYGRLSAHDPSSYAWATHKIDATVSATQALFRNGQREAAFHALREALDETTRLREQFGTDPRTFKVAMSAAGWMVFAATQAGEQEVAAEAVLFGLGLFKVFGLSGEPTNPFNFAEYGFRMNAARHAMRFLPPEEAAKALATVQEHARAGAEGRTAAVGGDLEATPNVIEHHIRHSDFAGAERIAAEATAFLADLRLHLDASARSVRRDIDYGQIFINVMRASGLSLGGDTPAATALLAETGVDDQWLRSTQGGNLVKFLDPIRDADPQGYAEVVEMNAGRVPGVSFGGTRKPAAAEAEAEEPPPTTHAPPLRRAIRPDRRRLRGRAPPCCPERLALVEEHRAAIDARRRDRIDGGGGDGGGLLLGGEEKRRGAGRGQEGERDSVPSQPARGHLADARENSRPTCALSKAMSGPALHAITAVARPSTRKKPHMSVTVVSMGPETSAGSRCRALSTRGSKPPKQTETRVLIAREEPTTMESRRLAGPGSTKCWTACATIASSTPSATPLSRPTAASFRSTRRKSRGRRKPSVISRMLTATAWLPEQPLMSEMMGRKTASAMNFSSVPV